MNPTALRAPTLTAALLAATTGPALAAPMEEVEVRASRTDTRLADYAGSVSVVTRDDIQLGRQQFALDESLNRVPGLFSQNRYNFAQDLRISIRGFGARANFGIRGIRVLVDGIPSTLTDGQTVIDDVELGAIERIEVLRGPSSSLYGSNAGGVLSLYTESGTDDPYVEGRITVGDYEQYKGQIKGGGRWNNLRYFMSGSYLTYEGFREHNAVRQGWFNSKFNYEIDDASDLEVVVNIMDSPLRQDAGGITLADVATDRSAAERRNVSSNAGEDIDQQKIGWTYNRDFGDRHHLTLRNYYIWRDFQTFLPIGSHIPFVADDGVTAFDRFFYGGGAQYTFESELFGRPNQFSIGFEADRQEDDRQRYINNAGVRGMLTFDQNENAHSVGVYFRNILALTDTFQVTLGGRYDSVTLAVDDKFLANGDQSAELDFDQFNPTAGINWNFWGDLNLFANYAAGFETPTFTELATPAREIGGNVNLGGFGNVQAQTADSYEVGLRGRIVERVSLDLAYFNMSIDDEVLGVELIGNRGIFGNADTERQGFEGAVVVDVFEGLRVTTSYTWSDFTIERFFDGTQLQPGVVGNDIPGIPRHQVYGEVAYTHPSGVYAIFDVIHVGSFFSDNANTVEAGNHEVANIRFGHSFTVGNTTVSPFLGVNNLFGRNYFANVRLNAFGGRAFEPAPDLNVYGGVNLRLAF